MLSAIFHRKAAAMCPPAPEQNTISPDCEQDDYVRSNTSVYRDLPVVFRSVNYSS